MDSPGEMLGQFDDVVAQLASDPDLTAAAEEPDFEDRLHDAIIAALTASGDEIAETLLNTMPAMLNEYNEWRTGFESRLRTAWAPSLELYEAFAVASREAGEWFNTRARPHAAETNDRLFDALVRLHARACLVAGEVLALLSAGYASGAQARWRTLHEVAVVAFFLREHGQDVAQRYLLHADIHRYKATLLYIEHQDPLGLAPLSHEEIETARKRRDELVGMFGSSYMDEWGWAADALGRERVTFRQIEDAVSIGHLRSYYKLASSSVHAGSHALSFDIGRPDDAEYMLAGPSQIGLSDPGQGACIALLQSTIALLTYRPDVEGALALKGLVAFHRRVLDAFASAHLRHGAPPEESTAPGVGTP